MTPLVDAAMQATVLASAALLALFAMPRASAAVRHAVLAASLVAVACAPVAMGMLPGWTPSWFSVDGLANSDASVQVRQLATSEEAGAHVARAAAATGSALRLMLITVLSLWLAGVAMHAARVGRALLRLARVRRHAVEWTDDRLSALRRTATGTVGLQCAPVVLLSPHADLVATWGVVRPRVVLPVQAATWPDERVAVVLTHEFAHIQRRDWVLQLVAEVVRCLQWYNPLVRLVCRRLHHESERACDDVVIRSGTPPARYAEHLVAIARNTRPLDRPWTTAVSMAQPQVSKGESRPCSTPRSTAVPSPVSPPPAS